MSQVYDTVTFPSVPKTDGGTCVYPCATL